METWLIPTGIVVAFAVLFLLPLAGVILPLVRRTRYACPIAGAEVSLELVSRSSFGIVEPVSVHSCSAFDDPENPTCPKDCLRILAPTRAP